MKVPLCSAFPVYDTAAAQIVGGQGYPYPVSRNDADIVLTHFAGKVGKDQVSILVVQFYPEHGVRQGFPNNSFNFYCFFFRHKNSFRFIREMPLGRFKQGTLIINT
jgi:hypothetical protein